MMKKFQRVGQKTKNQCIYLHDFEFYIPDCSRTYDMVALFMKRGKTEFLTKINQDAIIAPGRSYLQFKEIFVQMSKFYIDKKTGIAEPKMFEIKIFAHIKGTQKNAAVMLGNNQFNLSPFVGKTDHQIFCEVQTKNDAMKREQRILKFQITIDDLENIPNYEELLKKMAHIQNRKYLTKKELPSYMDSKYRKKIQEDDKEKEKNMFIEQGLTGKEATKAAKILSNLPEQQKKVEPKKVEPKKDDPSQLVDNSAASAPDGGISKSRPGTVANFNKAQDEEDENLALIRKQQEQDRQKSQSNAAPPEMDMMTAAGAMVQDSDDDDPMLLVQNTPIKQEDNLIVHRPERNDMESDRRTCATICPDCVEENRVIRGDEDKIEKLIFGEDAYFVCGECCDDGNVIGLQQPVCESIMNRDEAEMKDKLIDEDKLMLDEKNGLNDAHKKGALCKDCVTNGTRCYNTDGANGGLPDNQKTRLDIKDRDGNVLKRNVPFTQGKKDDGITKNCLQCGKNGTIHGNDDDDIALLKNGRRGPETLNEDGAACDLCGQDCVDTIKKKLGPGGQDALCYECFDAGTTVKVNEDEDVPKGMAVDIIDASGRPIKKGLDISKRGGLPNNGLGSQCLACDSGNLTKFANDNGHCYRKQSPFGPNGEGAICKDCVDEGKTVQPGEESDTIDVLNPNGSPIKKGQDISPFGPLKDSLNKDCLGCGKSNLPDSTTDPEAIKGMRHPFGEDREGALCNDCTDSGLKATKGSKPDTLDIKDVNDNVIKRGIDVSPNGPNKDILGKECLGCCDKDLESANKDAVKGQLPPKEAGVDKVSPFRPNGDGAICKDCIDDGLTTKPGEEPDTIDVLGPKGTPIKKGYNISPDGPNKDTLGNDCVGCEGKNKLPGKDKVSPFGPNGGGALCKDCTGSGVSLKPGSEPETFDIIGKNDKIIKRGVDASDKGPNNDLIGKECLGCSAFAPLSSGKNATEGLKHPFGPHGDGAICKKCIKNGKSTRPGKAEDSIDIIDEDGNVLKRGIDTTKGGPNDDVLGQKCLGCADENLASSGQDKVEGLKQKIEKNGDGALCKSCTTAGVILVPKKTQPDVFDVKDALGNVIKRQIDLSPNGPNKDMIPGQECVGCSIQKLASNNNREGLTHPFGPQHDGALCKDCTSSGVSIRPGTEPETVDVIGIKGKPIKNAVDISKRGPNKDSLGQECIGCSSKPNLGSSKDSLKGLKYPFSKRGEGAICKNCIQSGSNAQPTDEDTLFIFGQKGKPIMQGVDIAPGGPNSAKLGSECLACTPNKVVLVKDSKLPPIAKNGDGAICRQCISEGVKARPGEKQDTIDVIGPTGRLIRKNYDVSPNGPNKATLGKKCLSCDNKYGLSPLGCDGEGTLCRACHDSGVQFRPGSEPDTINVRGANGKIIKQGIDVSKGIPAPITASGSECLGCKSKNVMGLPKDVVNDKKKQPRGDGLCYTCAGSGVTVEPSDDPSKINVKDAKGKTIRPNVDITEPIPGECLVCDSKNLCNPKGTDKTSPFGPDGEGALCHNCTAEGKSLKPGDSDDTLDLIDGKGNVLKKGIDSTMGEDGPNDPKLQGPECIGCDKKKLLMSSGKKPCFGLKRPIERKNGDGGICKDCKDEGKYLAPGEEDDTLDLKDKNDNVLKRGIDVSPEGPNKDILGKECLGCTEQNLAPGEKQNDKSKVNAPKDVLCKDCVDSGMKVTPGLDDDTVDLMKNGNVVKRAVDVSPTGPNKDLLGQDCLGCSTKNVAEGKKLAEGLKFPFGGPKYDGSICKDCVDAGATVKPGEDDDTVDVMNPKGRIVKKNYDISPSGPNSQKLGSECLACDKTKGIRSPFGPNGEGAICKDCHQNGNVTASTENVKPNGDDKKIESRITVCKDGVPIREKIEPYGNVGSGCLACQSNEVNPKKVQCKHCLGEEIPLSDRQKAFVNSRMATAIANQDGRKFRENCLSCPTEEVIGAGVELDPKGKIISKFGNGKQCSDCVNKEIPLKGPSAPGSTGNTKLGKCSSCNSTAVTNLGQDINAHDGKLGNGEQCKRCIRNNIPPGCVSCPSKTVVGNGRPVPRVGAKDGIFGNGYQCKDCVLAGVQCKAHCSKPMESAGGLRKGAKTPICSSCPSKNVVEAAHPLNAPANHQRGDKKGHLHGNGEQCRSCIVDGNPTGSRKGADKFKNGDLCKNCVDEGFTIKQAKDLPAGASPGNNLNAYVCDKTGKVIKDAITNKKVPLEYLDGKSVMTPDGDCESCPYYNVIPYGKPIPQDKSGTTLGNGHQCGDCISKKKPTGTEGQAMKQKELSAQKAKNGCNDRFSGSRGGCRDGTDCVNCGDDLILSANPAAGIAGNQNNNLKSKPFGYDFTSTRRDPGMVLADVTDCITCGLPIDDDGVGLKKKAFNRPGIDTSNKNDLSVNRNGGKDIAKFNREGGIGAEKDCFSCKQKVPLVGKGRDETKRNRKGNEYTMGGRKENSELDTMSGTMSGSKQASDDEDDYVHLIEVEDVEEDCSNDAKQVVDEKERFMKAMDPVWKKYDKKNAGKLNHEEFYMVLGETLDNLNKDCGLTDQQIENQQQLVDLQYDNTFLQFDHDYDGKVEKSSGFDMTKAMLNHKDKDLTVLIGALERLRDEEENDDFFRQQRESDFGQSMMVRDSMIGNTDFKSLAKQAQALDEKILSTEKETKKIESQNRQEIARKQKQLDKLKELIIAKRREGQAERVKKLVMSEKSFALKKFLQFGILMMIRWINSQIEIQQGITDNYTNKLKIINRKLNDAKVKLFFYKENLGSQRFHQLTKHI